MRRGWIAPGLAAALLLAGCSGVPVTGSVERAKDASDASVLAEPDVHVDFAGPTSSEQPVDVVKGFIAANTTTPSSPGDVGSVREFLTRGATALWDPQNVDVLDSATLDYSVGGPAINQDNSDRVDVILRATAIGTLSGTGVFESDYRSVVYDFALSRTDSGWRIENPPRTVPVESEDFVRSYRPVDVYYLSRQSRTLVPDRRLVSGPRSAVPGAALAALFQGPSDWLAPAVRPLPGDGIKVETLTVRNGEARVELTEAATRLGSSQRSVLAAAIVWTLADQSLTGVRIEAGGRSLLASGPDVMTERDWPEFRPTRPDDKMAYLVAGSLLQSGHAPWSLTRNGNAPAQAAALAPDSSSAVVTVADAGGTALDLLDGAGHRTELLRGTSLTSPTWGGSPDRVFVVQDSRQLLGVDLTGATRAVQAYDVPAEWGTVRAASVAPDGVRVALLVGDPGAQRLLVGVLGESAADGVLGLREVPDLFDVRSVAWSETTTLVALAVWGLTGGLRTVTTAVDGSGVEQLGTSGLRGTPSSVAATPGGPVLAIVDGSVIEFGSDVWELVPGAPTSPTDLTALVAPGS